MNKEGGKLSNTVKRFEDLDLWKVARELSNNIYSISKKGPMVKDYGFSDQLRRAAVSIMNNTAEGFERGSNKDFAKFLFIAKASAGEVRSMLYLAMDQEYINSNEFNEMYDKCIRTSQLAWGLIKHLQKNSGWKTGCQIALMILMSYFLTNLSQG